MKTIPAFVSQYLWDLPLNKISSDNDSKFIIERILEYGDFDALDWVNKTYQRDQIIDVLRKSRKISPKTGNFYGLYYGIDRNSLECIRKPFTQKQNRF